MHAVIGRQEHLLYAAVHREPALQLATMRGAHRAASAMRRSDSSLKRPQVCCEMDVQVCDIPVAAPHSQQKCCSVRVSSGSALQAYMCLPVHRQHACTTRSVFSCQGP